MADLFAKYNCTYCQEDIAGLRVKCSTCPDFELCLQCFSYGAESGSHKNDHPYRFMDSGTIGVFKGRGVWSAREEMRLLDAVEQYGFGNWEDISKHIETRTPDEAKEEYVARYLEGNIGRLTWPAAASSRPTLSDTTAPDSGPLSPNVTARLPPLDASSEEATHLGYMPHRDDFEREFDNEAEALVSPLAVSSVDEEDIDIALKLAYVDMYTRRLRERTRRKRLCRDYQLVSNYFCNIRKEKPAKKKPSKFERDLKDKFRVYAQFFTGQEHESFIRSLVRQDELSLRVRELERYRRGGVTKFEECTHFEQQRARREDIKDKIAGSSGPILSAQSTETKNEERKSAESFYSSARKFTPSLWSVNSLQGSKGEGGQAAVAEAQAVVEDEEGGDEADVQQPLLPELRLLTAQEKKLCNSLSLPPYEYLSVKAQVLKEVLVPTHVADSLQHTSYVTTGGSGSSSNSSDCPVRQLLYKCAIIKSG